MQVARSESSRLSVRSRLVLDTRRLRLRDHGSRPKEIVLLHDFLFPRFMLSLSVHGVHTIVIDRGVLSRG